MENSLLIKNGKVITMSGKVYTKGDILIENGKIKAIEENIEEGGKILEASGLTIVPGFIEAHSHIGIEELHNENPGNLNEIGNPITPYLNGADGVNLYDESFQRALQSGVTTVATGPGSANVIGGTFCIVKTFGDDILKRILKRKSSMKVALGDNPKRIYSIKGKSPLTKMGITYLLKDALDKAKLSLENNGDNDLLEVLRGEMPLSIHAHRADDILTSIKIAEEYNIEIQILHATEGLKLKEEIKLRGIPLVLGPILNCSKKVETREKGKHIAKVFSEEEILTAISTDHPITPIEYLALSAGVCVGEGMDYYKALESITINPAKILKIDDKVGSIEIGKEGDLVIFEGDPLCSMSKVKYVVGNGKIVYKN